MRYVQPETTFIWFAFFWVGLGWQYVVLTTPDYLNEDSKVQSHNIILKFFMVATLFFGIGSVQLILNQINNFAYTSQINKFKDLCTFANISIIMLDEHARGFYLHGKVPWSTSDIPLDWLQKELQDEANGRPGSETRGLKNARRLPGISYEVQTFQIYVPMKLRQMLTEIRQQVYHIDEEVLAN